MFVQVTPSLSLYYDLLYNTVNSSLKSRNVYIVNIGERRSYLQFFLESQIINIFKNAIQIEGQWGWGVSTHTSWHKQFQIGLNTSECTIYRLFSFFSAVPNRFTSRHNACFRDIFFLLKFQIDSTVVRPQNTPFTVLVFKLFSAVPNRFKFNTARMHALDTLFSCFLCSFKSFQIPPGCML